ncbi:MAG: hypothetical protein N3A01_06870 [Bacteroidales bacterium]|nr:hypothetical protein [Bacteroidales bacterium]
MSKKIFILLILLYISSKIYCGEIVLDGIYQGKNLYVLNPFSSAGVGFCVYEVTVNGKVTTDEINSSAFEIDLSLFQFNIGDKITVVIKHKDNCLPKVLNPEVLKPKSTFNIVKIEVTKDGSLQWTTTGESGSLPYIVEQYRWNKWIKVAEVEGKGTSGTANYSVKVNLHSGVNKFRVKQIDYTKKPRMSPEATFKSLEPPVTITNSKFENEIVFSRETMYEIYDYYGNRIMKGIGSRIDISSLKKGDYFINFDNQMQTFKKKK